LWVSTGATVARSGVVRKAAFPRWRDVVVDYTCGAAVPPFRSTGIVSRRKTPRLSLRQRLRVGGGCLPDLSADRRSTDSARVGLEAARHHRATLLRHLSDTYFVSECRVAGLQEILPLDDGLQDSRRGRQRHGRLL